MNSFLDFVIIVMTVIAFIAILVFLSSKERNQIDYINDPDAYLE